MSDISVPINSELIGELYLRKGPKVDIANWIGNIIESYLENTENEFGWSDEYYEYVAEKNWDQNRINMFGDPNRGYNWTPIFLPNGSEISMEYKREKHVAVVKHEKIYYEDKTYTPSEFARAIANNTSRNAWRDLFIRKPGESKWILADQLRRTKS